ncbi:unnamed protein product [Paramecium pentaurelia]|uniref:Uncharacterized protein n=1 Tax=Paramecium pentaurelia TaxID=43138 RepID=A0A8S1WBQ4_9CILI|nr:unnamed protein product [Paramecium pentaurelia]
MKFVNIIRNLRYNVVWRCTFLRIHPLSQIPGMQGLQEFSDSEDWSEEENPSDLEVMEEFDSSGDEKDQNFGDIK